MQKVTHGKILRGLVEGQLAPPLRPEKEDNGSPRTDAGEQQPSEMSMKKALGTGRQDPLSRNNVKVFGEGERTLVFGHGFGCDQNMWRYVTPAFLRGHRIVLFDHVGAGESDASCYEPAKYASLEGYAQDLLEVCGALALESPVYVGHSVGAMIGVLAAVREPSLFGRLALLAPSPCYLNDGDYAGGFERTELEEMLGFMDRDYAGWSAAFAPLIMGNPERPSLGEELIHSFCATDSRIARQFARVTFLSDCRPVLPGLRTEALILQADQDMIAPPEVGEYLRGAMAGSTLVNLRAPLEVVAALEMFLGD